jgi:hypothetical protein
MLTALKFTSVLVSRRKVSTNYLHTFVFSVHLNLGYFLAANFWKNRSVAGDKMFFKNSFEKIKDYTFCIKQNWNEGGYCPFGGPLFLVFTKC